MALSTNTVTYVAPDSRKFKYKYLNIFYINGVDLSGASLDDLSGTVEGGARPIVWTDFGVLDNIDPTRILVFGIPWKGHPAGKRITADNDAGDLTSTVSNDGSQVTNTTPTDYAT